ILGPRLSGMGDLAAVLHQEAAVERDRVLLAEADADLALLERGPGVLDRLGDAVADLLLVGGIALVAQAADDRPARMGVAGGDEDVRAGDLRVLLDPVARLLHRVLADEELVDADERDRRLAVGDDAGDGVQRVAGALAGVGPEAARDRRAGFRR